jgi:hypothetical protein
MLLQIKPASTNYATDRTGIAAFVAPAFQAGTDVTTKFNRTAQIERFAAPPTSRFSYDPISK